MKSPAFATYFEDGLETPFGSPLLVGALALPYSLILTAVLRFPDKTFHYLFPILAAFTVYKLIIYGITYSTHYQSYSLSELTKPKENIGATISTTIVTLVLVALGTAVFIIPGIYLLIRLSLAIPIATIHGYPPRKSIMQSYKHTETQFRQIVGLAIEVSILAFFILSGVIAAIFVGFDFEIISWLGLLILSIIASIIELGSQAALIEILITQEN